MIVEHSGSWSDDKIQQKTEKSSEPTKNLMSMLFVPLSTLSVMRGKNWWWHDILSFLIITFSAALHSPLSLLSPTWWKVIYHKVKDSTEILKSINLQHQSCFYSGPVVKLFSTKIFEHEREGRNLLTFLDLTSGFLCWMFS